MPDNASDVSGMTVVSLWDGSELELIDSQPIPAADLLTA